MSSGAAGSARVWRVVAAVVGAGSLCLVGALATPQSMQARLANSLSVVARNGYFARGSTWDRQAPVLEGRIRSSASLADAEDPVVALVQLAGGAHSALLTSPAPGADATSQAVASPMPSLHERSGVAVLSLPAFVAYDDRQAFAYASAAVTEVRDALRARPCGWVVDLRQNSGGTTLAMLAAVSPLLPDGPVMGIVDNAGVRRQVRVVGNAVTVQGDQAWAAGGFPFVKVPAARVAVLTDGGTASAAEAVALAFRSSSTARSFGAPTRGLTSYNEAFPLPNGWAVRLTTGAFTDVAGATYLNVRLRPDEPSSAPFDSATKWLAPAGCR